MSRLRWAIIMIIHIIELSTKIHHRHPKFSQAPSPGKENIFGGGSGGSEFQTELPLPRRRFFRALFNPSDIMIVTTNCTDTLKEYEECFPPAGEVENLEHREGTPPARQNVLNKCEMRRDMIVI